jgi:hypothetical protein
MYFGIVKMMFGVCSMHGAEVKECNGVPSQGCTRRSSMDRDACGSGRDLLEGTRTQMQ